MSENKISNSVIRRLPRYYRFLNDLLDEGVTKISSRELSERMKLTASQIRQDLNCFGGFGQQGYGYNVRELTEEIAGILCVDKQLNTIIIGAGNLGNAIAMHIKFERNGFKLQALFDIDRRLCDRRIMEIPVIHMSQLELFCEQYKPKVAVLCIPKTTAKEVCEQLISLGVKNFWNFSHFDLNLHYDDIIVENVHLSDSLMTFSYKINQIEKQNDEKLADEV